MVWGREAGEGRSVVCVGLVASRPAIYVFWRYARRAGRLSLTRSGYWQCEADAAACNKDLLCTPGAGSAFDGPACARLLFQGVRRSGRKDAVPRRSCVVWGGQMAQVVRLERQESTSCRVGEGGGWLGNVRLHRREVQMWFGHGQLSGAGSAFGSCSSQGLPMRNRKAAQWCRVRMRRGEAQKY